MSLVSPDAVRASAVDLGGLKATFLSNPVQSSLSEAQSDEVCVTGLRMQQFSGYLQKRGGNQKQGLLSLY